MSKNYKPLADCYKTFMSRLKAGLFESRYCVEVKEWHTEDIFALCVVDEFERNFNKLHQFAGLSSYTALKGCKVPNVKYLKEIVYRLMKDRYGWNEGKDYRKWCRENPGKILVIEVIGDDEVEAALHMRYENKEFQFMLK